jgi:hypothetical protein
MGGGKDMPMLISTRAIVRIGKTIAKVKNIIPRINFFMFYLPYYSKLSLLLAVWQHASAMQQIPVSSLNLHTSSSGARRRTEKENA